MESDFPFLGMDADVDQARVDFNVKEGRRILSFGNEGMVGWSGRTGASGSPLGARSRW